MITIRTRGREVEIPAEIDELNPAQYEYYCSLLLAVAAGAMDSEAFRVRWLSYLVGLKRANFTILLPEFREELAAQLSAVDSFLNPEPEGSPLRIATTRNLLPSYRGYSGPGDWLEGLRFGDFVECLSLMESIDAADEAATLAVYEQMARILYRIPEADKVPDLLLFHAPTFFSSVWRAIMAGPVEINGKNIDFRIIFKSTGSDRRDDGTGWAGITFEVATAGLFGNVKEVEAVEFWDVLLYLYRCKFEYLEELKKNNKK